MLCCEYSQYFEDHGAFILRDKDFMILQNIWNCSPSYNPEDLNIQHNSLNEYCTKKLTIFFFFRDFDPNSSDFTLEAFIRMKMQNYATEINEVSNTASMELAVEMVCTVLCFIGSFCC